MGETIQNILGDLDRVNGYLWGQGTFFLLLGAGILFTVLTRFSQWRVLIHGYQVIRGRYDNPDDPGSINHFQALLEGRGGPGTHLFFLSADNLLAMAKRSWN